MINSLFRSGSSYHILSSRCFIFSFPGVPSSHHHEDPSKSLQGFTVCFQLLFLFIILLLPEFFMEALHGGSSRIPFSLHFSSRFPSRLWSAKLYSKLNMVLNTCFVLRSSRILHLVFRSATPSILSFEVVLCHYW